MSSSARARGWLAVTAALSLLTLSSQGCGDQSGSPQPVPIPDPAQFRCTGVLPGQPIEVTLLGLPQATAGAGEVLVRNVTRGGEVRAQASAGGSFWAALTADAVDRLEVSFEGSGTVSFEVPATGVAAPPPPEAIPGVTPVVASGGGEARVRGQVAAGVSGVFVVAPDSGEVVVAPVDPQWRFDVLLRAGSGEPIEVYNQAPVLEGAWSLTAP